jgi:hypothetical protein
MYTCRCCSTELEARNTQAVSVSNKYSKITD